MSMPMKAGCVAVIGMPAHSLRHGTSFCKQLLCGKLTKSSCFSCLAANGTLLFFYMSPLSSLFEVLRKHDSSSIVLPLAAMNTINGGLWCMYGLTLRDAFIWVPNGVGAALGAIQLTLRFMFPRVVAGPKAMCAPFITCASPAMTCLVGHSRDVTCPAAQPVHS